jgi:hypothetical protein
MDQFEEVLDVVVRGENIRDSLFFRSRDDFEGRISGMLESREKYLETFKGPQDIDEAKILYEEAISDYFGDITIPNVIDLIWKREDLRLGFLTYVLEYYESSMNSEFGLNPWDDQNRRILLGVKAKLDEISNN